MFFRSIAWRVSIKYCLRDVKQKYFVRTGYTLATGLPKSNLSPPTHDCCQKTRLKSWKRDYSSKSGKFSSGFRRCYFLPEHVAFKWRANQFFLCIQWKIDYVEHKDTFLLGLRRHPCRWLDRWWLLNLSGKRWWCERRRRDCWQKFSQKLHQCGDSRGGNEPFQK